MTNKCKYDASVLSHFTFFDLHKSKKAEKQQVKKPGSNFQKVAIGKQTKKLEKHKKVSKKSSQGKKIVAKHLKCKLTKLHNLPNVTEIYLAQRKLKKDKKTVNKRRKFKNMEWQTRLPSKPGGKATIHLQQVSKMQCDCTHSTRIVHAVDRAG
jgi:hypothetical protein